MEDKITDESPTSSRTSGPEPIESFYESGNEKEFAIFVREMSEGNADSVFNKVKSLEDSLLRTRAEVENVRRRLHFDIEKARRFSVEGFAAEMLPVLDSLDAVLNDNSDSQKIKEGIRLTAKQLQMALERNKVLSFDPISKKFDPTYHQAVSTLDSEESDGIVVSVLQKGYTMWGRLLRPALVVVSKRKVSSIIN